MDSRRMQKELRIEKILLSLKKLDYLTRSQIQRLHNLGSDRNANKVLNSMSEYLSTFRHGENVYYLNAEGRERVGATKVRKKTIQIEHFLLRNELYMIYGQPVQWDIETLIEIPKVAKVITDVMFVVADRFYFGEVDCTQKMVENKGKIERYKKIKESGLFQKKFGYFPKLVWITTTNYRANRLRIMCEGLTASIHSMEDHR